MVSKFWWMVFQQKRKNRKRGSQNSLVTAELGNCASFRQPFHDSAKQHACKGCGGKIHSSILCPKCPKVVDHEEDNWCSDRCLQKNYMRKTYPNTPLSEFRTTDAYVLTHGLDALVDDEEEEKDEEV